MDGLGRAGWIFASGLEPLACKFVVLRKKAHARHLSLISVKEF
jgi:hypothetical protein